LVEFATEPALLKEIFVRGAYLVLAGLCLAVAVLLLKPASLPEGGPGASAPDLLAEAQVTDTAEARALRRDMVRLQLEARGIRDTAVLRAMGEVPRHRFVPGAPTAQAYGDYPLPIGHGQTISQPYIVAFMTEAANLASGDRVLEIGTGSGYGAAVLGQVASEVFSIEIVPELAQQAERVLRTLGYENIRVRTGNGWLGWPEEAPYDAIVVTAAPERIPPELEDQLALGGTMVIPVGDILQFLLVLRKTPSGLQELATMPVRFVPMVSEPPDTGR
jgi:protein-L-isoaspartate(D-aspartate) O-methyltransferase